MGWPLYWIALRTVVRGANLNPDTILDHRIGEALTVYKGDPVLGVGNEDWSGMITLSANHCQKIESVSFTALNVRLNGGGPKPDPAPFCPPSPLRPSGQLAPTQRGQGGKPTDQHQSTSRQRNHRQLDVVQQRTLIVAA